MESPSSIDAPDSIVIGFDVGTAFSAIAYHLVTSTDLESQATAFVPEVLNDLATVNFLHGALGGGTEVRSQLAWYEQNSQWVFGHMVDELIKSGELQEAERIVMVKLCLERSPRTESIRNKVCQQLDHLPEDACREFGHHKPPTFEDLMGLYLRFLWKRAIEDINSYHGDQSRGIFHAGRAYCRISVPKLWSTSINQAMMSAAEWAGIPNVDLVHEPEAAATFCLLEHQVKASRAIPSIKKSLATQYKSVLILDAGCGTVDLVTYHIESWSPCLLMSESIKGTAGLQGSGLLNQEYHDFLRWFLKPDLPSTIAATRSDGAGQVKQILDIAVESFESQKRSFGSNDERKFRIHDVPGLKQRFKNSRGLLGPGGKHIPRENIVDIFEKIVVEIIAMVRQQIKDFNDKQMLSSAEALGCILFVGGLSSNHYVLNRLTMAFSGPDSLVGYNVPVIKASKDSSSHVVAKGAVLKAIYEPVSHKILAQSFGVKWDEDYNPEFHSDARPKPDAHDGRMQALDRMKWLCRVRDVVQQGEPVIFSVRGWRVVPLFGNALIVETLYASYTETQDHIPVDLETIHEFGRLEFDIGEVDRRKFPRIPAYKDKSKCARTDYEVQLIFVGVLLTYRLIIPELGRWWDFHEGDEYQDQHWGECPTIIEAKIKNAAGAFDVSGYRVHNDPSPKDKPLATTVSGRFTLTAQPCPLSEDMTVDPRKLITSTNTSLSPAEPSSPASTSTSEGSNYVPVPALSTRRRVRLLNEKRSKPCVRCREENHLACRGKIGGRACRRCLIRRETCVRS